MVLGLLCDLLSSSATSHHRTEKADQPRSVHSSAVWTCSLPYRLVGGAQKHQQDNHVIWEIFGKQKAYIELIPNVIYQQ
jgi:hypothetical protein